MVGIADVVPKLIAYRLIEPALRLPEPVQVICHEDKPDRLLAELSVHGNDLVLTDSPVSPTVKVRAYNHLPGECSVTVFGAERLAATYRRGFPRSLDGAPFLFPTANTMLRRSLDQWFEGRSLRPAVRERFYAISVERRLKHPAVVAISDAARRGLFG